MEKFLDQNVSVVKYVIRFSIAYFIFLVVLGSILALLNVDGNTGGSIGALLGAVMVAVHKFADDYKRVPNKAEKKKLVWLSFFAAWLVSFLLFSGAILLFGGIDGLVDLAHVSSQLNSLIMIGILVLVLVSIFYLIALSISYGSLANLYIKSLRKKGKI